MLRCLCPSMLCAVVRPDLLRAGSDGNGWQRTAARRRIVRGERRRPTLSNNLMDRPLPSAGKMQLGCPRATQFPGYLRSQEEVVFHRFLSTFVGPAPPLPLQHRMPSDLRVSFPPRSPVLPPRQLFEKNGPPDPRRALPPPQWDRVVACWPPTCLCRGRRDTSVGAPAVNRSAALLRWG